jgi:hypothetical protein
MSRITMNHADLDRLQSDGPGRAAAIVVTMSAPPNESQLRRDEFPESHLPDTTAQMNKINHNESVGTAAGQVFSERDSESTARRMDL